MASLYSWSTNVSIIPIRLIPPKEETELLLQQHFSKVSMT